MTDPPTVNEDHQQFVKPWWVRVKTKQMKVIINNAGAIGEEAEHTKWREGERERERGRHTHTHTE